MRDSKYLMSLEWSVLQSIHPTICVSNDDDQLALRIPVQLQPDAQIRIDVHPISLSVLPPLHLRIALPPTYPSQSPPLILSLHATSAWLQPSILALIEQRLIAMWSPGDDSGVLYNWVEWIRTGDFLADIGLLADGTIQIPHPSPQLLIPPLLAYAASSKSDEFAHTSFPCAICLTERKGAHCLALSCGHVFCKACLTDMWRLHVNEGQISHVGCPEPNCRKNHAEEADADGFSEATEDEVRAILSENELDRWKWLRTKRDLERDPTMVHCPMEFCQEPVPMSKPDKTETNTDEDDSSWARLRTCGACGYSFCASCRRCWHGPHTPCPHPLTSKFILAYLSAPPNSSKRRVIEHRYGRNNVLRLVRQHEEDQENRKWMDSSTMACPGCDIRVEKSMGCNHMTCPKCGTHFCYRCGTKIYTANPYLHFSTPNTPCFAKLFDPVSGIEDEWQPVEGFGLI